MLDDLQTTVTRTAQHLDSANASKSRDVQFLKPSNSTTVVEERTASPGGVSSRIYAQLLVAMHQFHLNLNLLKLYKVFQDIYAGSHYKFIQFLSTYIQLCIN